MTDCFKVPKATFYESGRINHKISWKGLYMSISSSINYVMWLHVIAFKVHWTRRNTSNVRYFRANKRTVVLEQETQRQWWNDKSSIEMSLRTTESQLQASREKDKRTKGHWLFGLAQQWKWKGKEHIVYSNFLEFINQNTIVALWESFLTKFKFHCGPDRIKKIEFLKKTRVRTRVLKH